MSTTSAASARGPAAPDRQGTLRVYLGAAPGVGKTYAMLNEGRRRKSRGTDVVVGLVETHGRALTAEQIADLEVVPRKRLEYRGATFEEMDVDAVLARRPRVALVDELAHTNVPGSRHVKRWQDVRELLAAGIDVVSTVNIQHLESINDVVEQITGVVQRETIPDDVVRAADQVELVDMTPEALRRRMAHGNVYAPEKVDAALANYFRPGNLGALRELALLWVADQVDTALEEYRARHGITRPWEARERVLVAMTGAPGTEALIRRAARIAQRAHGDLLGVHVRNDEGLVGSSTAVLERHRKLLAEIGGEYHDVTGDDTVRALLSFAEAENCTQIVMGASNRSRFAELVRGSVINGVIRRSGPIDVHVISHEPAPEATAVGWSRARTAGARLAALSSRRRLTGLALAAAGLPALTVVLVAVRDSITLTTVVLLYLLFAVITAAVGGAVPALVAAAGGFMLANWYFTPPLHQVTVSRRDNLIALLIFVAVAGVVTVFVDVAARRAGEAARARAEAETLARLAATMGAEDPLHVLLEHLRVTFVLASAAILRRDGGGWRVEAAAGYEPPESPAAADAIEEVSPDLVLALSGRRLAAEDRRVLTAFAAQLAAAYEQSRLSAQARRAAVLDQANELRTALLQAVSHDLRTPLASIKASVSSLRQSDVEWDAGDVAELLATIEQETDRLTGLVGNLLDMSRLQAGVVEPALRPVGLDEVVPAALAGLDVPEGAVDDRVDETLPPVSADPALLERVVANLVGNALEWSPPGAPVRLTAGVVGDRVDLHVVDRGPGIPAADRERVFRPFQRTGDAVGGRRRGIGVGLGLAVARGFVEAMKGELAIDDTPGGGTIAVVSLPLAAAGGRHPADHGQPADQAPPAAGGPPPVAERPPAGGQSAADGRSEVGGPPASGDQPPAGDRP